MVAGTYLPAINGAAISTRNFKHSLEQKGHPVFLVAPAAPGYADKEPNVVRKRSLHNPFYKDIRLPFYFAGARDVAHWRAKNIDVVHVMQPYVTGRYAQKVARALGVPVIFTWHTRYDLKAHYVKIVPTRLARWWIVRSVTKFGNACSSVIAPSSSIEKHLRSIGVTVPIEVIPTGLAESFKDEEPRAVLRDRFKLPQDALVILCVARIALEEKNLLLLLDAYTKIHAQLGKNRLVFVGGGPDLEKLRSIIKERHLGDTVISTGFIDQERLSEYYSSADIFAYPSISETQGLISAEAMSAGLPVVATRAPGNDDIVRDGENGTLTANRVDDFAAGILMLAGDPELRARLAVGAQKTASEFSMPTMAEKLLQLYTRLRHEHIAANKQK